MGATLISLTSFTPVKFGAQDGATSSAVLINPSNIISVKTRDSAYNTTGITDVEYQFVVNNMKTSATLIVEEASSAILTAANANVAAV